MQQEEYWRGYQVAYKHDLSLTIERNGRETIKRINELFVAFGEERAVTSGWRPQAVNSTTPGAAQFSKHIMAQACDLADPEGDLDDWALEHPSVLQRIGLWQEHPAATKGWAHFQTVPPKSGKRTFYP